MDEQEVIVEEWNESSASSDHPQIHIIPEWGWPNPMQALFQQAPAQAFQPQQYQYPVQYFQHYPPQYIPQQAPQGHVLGMPFPFELPVQQQEASFHTGSVFPVAYGGSYQEGVEQPAFHHQEATQEGGE